MPASEDEFSDDEAEVGARGSTKNKVRSWGCLRECETYVHRTSVEHF